MDSMRIDSLNTRGLKNKLKRMALFSFIKQQKLDIACLQETHINEKEAVLWEKQWVGKLFFFTKGQYTGLEKLYLFPKVLRAKLHWKRVRILIVSVKTENCPFILVNLYAPNDVREKMKYFDKLDTELANYTEKNLLVVGDVNSVMSNELDIISGRPHCQKEVDKLKETVGKLALVDVWRSMHDKEKEYTWSKHNPLIARRLDCCFANENTFQFCVSCNILSVANTDHRAIKLEMNKSDFVRGPGYWRFNNSYLPDVTFTNKMNELLDNLLTENEEIQGNAQKYW